MTHGGIQDPSWTHGPPWELQIAYMMKEEGFDSVIPYNWVLQSSTPGEAIKQSPRLARIILGTANRFPANAPVDLEFIGHSEGTVVNTYAIAKLQSEMTPQLTSGFIEDTLLDPHAANNGVASGQQVSYAGPLAGLAKFDVTHYQAEAKDPPAYFPSIVDEAQVFYEHTAATAGGIYNLWGQVPVKSDGPLVHYYNLTRHGRDPLGKHGNPRLVPELHRPHPGRPGPPGPATPAQWPDRRRPIARDAGRRPGQLARPAAWTMPSGRSRSCRPVSRSSPARPRPGRSSGSTSGPRRSPPRSRWPAGPRPIPPGTGR